MSDLSRLTQHITQSIGLMHKRDIAAVADMLKQIPFHDSAVPLGDDCAAIPDRDGFLLLATEGFLNEFVDNQPWFAGYYGVMVNVSDIYAMGGRPIAVVDAIWSDGEQQARPVLEGMAAASEIYRVPIVGGHSNLRTDRSQLSVAILGRANRLLSSFEAKAGQKLLAAVDLRGHFREPYAWWDASTGSPPERLREDLELLPQLAETGLCAAAKDISMAGMIGTVLMLLECSGLGGTIDVASIPCPPGIPLERWLCCFPSYGFVLSAEDEHTEAIIERFSRRGIACTVIGGTDASGRLRLVDADSEELLWDLHAEPLTGCGIALKPEV
ncbi:sll0787 family AIR synthase-like protein [Methylobacter sp.]|uniref:sll0787 family AIR synthase-like protein n=1 Tax=Methylobacter sp. TaxID=2051955 RepID=UPI0024892D24|nr:sll0787 family AIR synthase-like protein [Methylobacter sp.]MDI1278554.1 sll0787 family AIR synthase-like protein [Methylobacter sp.]MDI1359331.1 sll0787 family AIR synthase-like protein [Methylobacter sp.]